MPTSDLDLITATAAGDHEAFGEFVRRYTAPLFRYCHGSTGDRHAAEDCAQEAFLRFFRQIIEGKTPKDPAAWVFGVARQCCQETHRKQIKQATVRLNEVEHVLSGLPESVDASEEIESMLEQLTDDQRSLIYMKHVGGLRCREIAEQTGKPLGTVTAALSRAYKSLRESLSTSRSTSSHRGGGS
jgi:RNA polymerase sigma-70 factor (ECF subfamily)